MSFEGYYQVLCRKGHYHTEDCYDHPLFAENDRYIDPTKPVWTCPDCGAAARWSNLVDVTNGSYDEEGNRIDGAVVLIPKPKDEDREQKEKRVQDFAAELGLKVVIIDDRACELPEGAGGHFYESISSESKRLLGGAVTYVSPPVIIDK
jgi:hypothetical protein